MRLLLIATPEQDDYVQRFLRLPSLTGHVVKKTTSDQPNVATIEALCRKHEIDAVICSQPTFLRAALDDTVDWIAPIGNKKVSLDDYAGSLLECRSGRLPVLVINPLNRLFSVASEKHVTDRFVSKLTRPHKWYKQTPFVWKIIEPHEHEAVLARLEQAMLIGIDSETIKDDFRSIEMISYTGYYPDTHTTESYVVMTVDSMEGYDFCKRANELTPPKVFQNGIYDNTYFLRWGIPCTGWYFDTFHLFHSWLCELPKRLDFIAAYTIRRIRYWKDDSDHNKPRYCAMDGWSTINSLLSILQDCPEYTLGNYLHEFPTVYPCVTVALEGLDVDVPKFMENQVKFKEKNEELLKRIRYILGWEDFNPNSWQQMTRVFDLLGCNYGSTDAIATKKAEYAHPFNSTIFSLTTEYKENTKLLGTYLDPDKLWDGRLYYSINPGTTDTLRTSSEASAFWYGFQIQNVPTGEDVKGAIVAPEGWFIGEVDQAQAEARCVAYLSGDKNLMALVESTHDYHAWNAAAFFGIPYEKIYNEETKKKLDVELRDLSKRTNHGANYNMTAPVLLDTMSPKKAAEAKKTLKLPKDWSLRRVCEFLLDRYAKTYPGVKGDWYAHIIDTIKTTKRLVSAFGWVRTFFGDIDQKPVLNAAVAHGPQNLSGMILNKAWYKIWRSTIYGELRGHVRIKAMIHDSLLFIYKQAEYTQKLLRMTDASTPVTDCKGITREMVIPYDLSLGKTPTRVWAEIK